MLPPTDAKVSVSLDEKPAPQSWREKILGTWVCFTRESKNGSRLSSGWRKAEAGQGCVSRGHPDVPSVPQESWLCTLLGQGSRTVVQMHTLFGPTGTVWSYGERKFSSYP